MSSAVPVKIFSRFFWCFPMMRGPGANASTRRLIFLAYLAARLQRLEQAGRKWRELRPGGPDDLVFATRTKKPLSDGNLLKRYVYPACDRLKIPRVSWHMFRHLHGTLLSQLGVPVAVAQAQLGHADPRITLQIYTHVLPDAQRDAVSRLERFLLDSNGPKLHQNRATEEIEIHGKFWKD
jgi:integrase